MNHYPSSLNARNLLGSLPTRSRSLASGPVTLLLLVTLVLGAAPASLKSDALTSQDQRAEHTRLVRSGETRVVQARQVQRQRQAQRIIPAAVLAAAWRATAFASDTFDDSWAGGVVVQAHERMLESLLSLPPPVV